MADNFEMEMQLQKYFGPHFHKKRERGDSIIELRVWLCTEKLLLHVSPRGLSILGLLLRALLKGRIKLQRVPALRGFWDLEKTVLHEIRVSGTGYVSLE